QAARIHHGRRAGVWDRLWRLFRFDVEEVGELWTDLQLSVRVSIRRESEAQAGPRLSHSRRPTVSGVADPPATAGDHRRGWRRLGPRARPIRDWPARDGSALRRSA